MHINSRIKLKIAMILDLLRARQWYKNLVIFLPIIFAGALFNKQYLLIVLSGFASLCLASSASYIINDIADAKEDKKHPEKRKRPIASGKIGVFGALAASILLFITSLAIATRLSYAFSISVLALFILTQVYTFFLKREPFADVTAISTNFVIRAVSGALVIDVRVSPWLILCTFFLSMFLVAGKRKCDFGRNNYSKATSEKIMEFSTTALVLSYSLYAFFGLYPALIITLPIAIYVIFSYAHLTEKKPEIARNPERAFLEPRIIVAIALWVLLSVIVVYRPILAS